MDTKLKRFNLSAFFKLVAIGLCLLCVGGTVTQLSSSFLMMEERDLTEKNFIDALYSNDNQEEWESRSFKNEFMNYAHRLSRIIATYGDGSEEAYNRIVESKTKSNTEIFERVRKNLISSVEQRQGFFNYLVAVSSGEIVNCGFAEAVDKNDDENYFTENEIRYYDTDYDWLADSGFYADVILHELALTDEARKQADETKADGIVYLSSEAAIYDEDGYTVASYPSGYYLFRVDDTALKENLVAERIIDNSVESLETFRKNYESEMKYLEENYSSGRYFIRDVKGNTYTNIEKLDKKSTEQEIATSFEGFGFYTVDDGYYGMVLPDGSYYSDISLTDIFESVIFDEGTIHYYEDSTVMTGITVVPYHTTTLPPSALPEITTGITSVTDETTTTVSATVEESTTVFVKGVETTAPVFPTTSKDSSYNGKSPFIYITEEPSDMDIIIGVDMNSESYSNKECKFSQLKNKIILARDMAKDTIKTCGTLVLLFIALMIFLIMYSGRRFGDKENVYMLPGDNMFTDWRALIYCGLGVLIVLLSFWVIDELIYDDEAIRGTGIKILGVLYVAFSALVLDLVLFTVRHIKNKTLFKKLFLVWLIRKTTEKSVKMLKIKSRLLSVLLVLFVPVNFFGLAWIDGFCDNEYELLLIIFLLFIYDLTTAYLFAREKNWLPAIKQKLEYVKGFEKETVIKGAVVLTVNLVGIFFGLIEIVNNGTAFIAVILGIFDAFVCVQLVRFIVGVRKIFSAVNELKDGNYDVHINLVALPSSLREPANRLMSLRDGLKSAVSEAVRQEQTKTELITNVSHDLKTPLTSVINYVELLKRCNIEDETAKEYLDVLGEKSDRLKKLIEDLVEASKASTGNIKAEIIDVSLNEITSQIIGEYSDIFDNRGLSLITSFPEENVIVKADSKMLYRVLENLMGNVAKYAMENTRVYLNVERRDSVGIIAVKNISGSPLNITAEQLKSRFVRGDEARSTEGSGLGLSIAESLCTIQGGRLNIIINGDLFVAEVEMKIG